jgi:structural maintenance of chromosome 4
MSFKDVAVELRRLGIDLDHNRFLILQGEVEAISLMPPKGKYNEKGDMVDEGMLEYLEDIIGSNRFIEQIKATESKVEELNVDRAMKLSNVKIVEKEKDGLEGSKTEAEAMLIEENSLTAKRNECWQKYGAIATTNGEEATTAMEAAQAKFNEKQAELVALEASTKDLEKSHAADLADHKQLKATAESVKAEFAAFERKDVQLREKLKHGKTKGKKLDKSLKEDAIEVNKTETEIAALEQDCARFTTEIEQCQVKLTEAESALEVIKESTKSEKVELKVELEAKQTELEPFALARNEAKSNVDILTQELDLLNSNKRNLENQLAEAKVNLEKASTTGATMTKEIDEMQKRRGVAEKECAASTKTLGKIAAEEPDLNEKVRSKRAKVEEVKSTSGQARQQSAVFTALMKTKRPGIYGRLGDLGAIDAKYDCPVTTACSALNNLVVDTIATGQWCIKYLKENDIGRVTIICLDKQGAMEKECQRPFATPAGTSRLFDLIRVKDERFKAAFYYGLRNTLVADDLDHATKVAFSGSTKNRVVTLKGQMIETSGAMSGGGNRPQTGGMSSKIASEVVSPAEIAKMEKDLAADMQVLTGHREQRTKLKSTVASLTKELASFDIRIKKCEMAMTEAKKVEPELKVQVAEFEAKLANSKSDVKQQANLEAQVAKATAALTKATDGAGKYEAEVERVQAAIKNVGGVPMKAGAAKVKSLNKQVETQRSSLAKSNVDGKTAKSKLKKLGKKVEKDTESLEATKEEGNSVMAELLAMEGDATAVMNSAAEAQQVLKEKEETMHNIGKEFKAAEAAVGKLQSAAVDLEEDLRAITATVKENQAKAKHWKSRVKKLKLHKVGSEYFDDDDDEEEEEEEAAEDDAMDGAAAAAAAEPAEGDEGEGAAAPKASKKAVLGELTEEELAAVDVDVWEREITMMEEQMGGKKANTKAIKEYYEKEEQYINKVSELDDVTEQRDAVRAEYEDLRKQRLDTFFDGFKKITTKLKEMYQMITLGGDAELEYVDNINPFSEGIVFSVRPPRKSWKAIQNLSGGEKTLSSLALVFALHHYKPTPLYVMDEIDAALDFKNVSIVAHYIKERTKNAQFIIISLRNNMFELADRLVGIYKTDNCTKTVTINPAAIASAMAATGSATPSAAAVASAQKTHEAAVASEPLQEATNA